MGNLRMNADQISYKGGKKPMSVEEAIKNAGNTGLAHTADIAPDFSTESAYNAGDLVYHNGTLYVFTSNHAAGAWSTDDTQAVTVGGELADVKRGLTNLIKYVDVTITDTITLTAGTPKYLAYTSSIDGAKIIGVRILSTTGDSTLDGTVGAYLGAYNFIHLLSTSNKTFASITVRLFYLG